jgi:hypothetical protein
MMVWVRTLVYGYQIMKPFGCADKPTEKHCWLICYERKILFRLKKPAEKTDYKPNEQGLWMLLFKCNMQTTVLAPLAPLDLVLSYSIPDKYFHW